MVILCTIVAFFNFAFITEKLEKFSSEITSIVNAQKFGFFNMIFNATGQFKTFEYASNIVISELFLHFSEVNMNGWKNIEGSFVVNEVF